MKKVFLPLFLLLSCHLYSCQWEIPSARIRKAPELMATRLMRSPEGFFVQTQGKMTHIPIHEIDKKIRQMSKEELSAFLALNKLTLREHTQGYSVEANELGKGGGPITGAIGGCLVFVGGAVTTTVVAVTQLAAGSPASALATGMAGAGATSALGIKVAALLTAIPFLP